VDAGLKGQRALITGGGSGIGLGIARALVAEGVNVVLASRTPRMESVEELRSNGGQAAWIHADVSSETGVMGMVRDAWDVFGGLELYVNNAAGTWHQPITALTAASWERTIATNLVACVFACRELARRFIDQGRGSILVVGSTAAHTPLYGETAYRVSKTGLKAFVEVLAIELAPYRIRVNLLTPGAFITELTRNLPARQMGGPFIPLRRPGNVEELGGSAVLLLSDRLSSYTTGAELVVDGGFRLRPMDLYTDDELLAMNRPGEGQEREGQSDAR
jgi:NAD(P)-dependent dehydrogenase (short-subunit alcohol dehydrogenase family)